MKIMKEPKRRAGYLGSVAFVVVFVAGISAQSPVPSPEKPEAAGVTTDMLDAMKSLPGEIGALPAVGVPAENPQTPAKIALGTRLFFDARLSGDHRSSCASCHIPEKAYGDGLRQAMGFGGVTLKRNSPTILNAAYNTAQFWDGRAKTLEEQCSGPIMASAEMNMKDEQSLAERLRSVPGYREEFQTVFGAPPTLTYVTQAIAAFERTLITPGSRFDDYARGRKDALNEQEKRGLLLFIGKAACTQCHKGTNFTDNKFHNLGEAAAGQYPEDLGRYRVSKKTEDRGAFKTPSLRNVTLTGPYMHDGSLATLEEVVDLYDRGAGTGAGKSSLLHKLNLTTREKADLVGFMKTLTGTMPQVAKPRQYADAVAQRN